MGKRKRPSKDDDGEIVKSLLKKVKKLVRKRRRISSSSSDDEPTLPSLPQSQIIGVASDLESYDEIPIAETPTEVDQTERSQGLDPDILELLGTDPTQDKSFGDDLHQDLAVRWKHILTNGLPKDDKCELMKIYLPAENCTHMKAPKLNLEIKSALGDISSKRDAYSEQKQNQMSSCISAIGKALNLALSQTENVQQELIKTLSDAGRLLCDTHYRESLSRRFALVNSISKQKRDMIKNTKIDEYLFGTDLSDHLKSSKAISRSASELRAKYNQPSSSQRQALNARGTPRGQAAEPRVNPGQPRRQAPPPPPPPPLPPPPPPPPAATAPRGPRRDPVYSRPNYRQQNRRR